MTAATKSRKPAATSQTDWDAHLATLAAAHATNIRLNTKLSQGWYEEASVRSKYTAKAQREADASGKTWSVVDFAGNILATCTPNIAKPVELCDDDELDFASLV